MNHVRDLAATLRKRYGTRDPFALCEHMDIAVLTADLPPVTKGIYFKIRGRRVINLNRSLPAEERRAVCAHELGHALLHPTCHHPFLSVNTGLVPGRYEREADYFSACLLLDEPERPYGECTVEQLAAEYRLPPHAVALWAGQR